LLFVFKLQLHKHALNTCGAVRNTSGDVEALMNHKQTTVDAQEMVRTEAQWIGFNTERIKQLIPAATISDTARF
jgi:hypothetical protein